MASWPSTIRSAACLMGEHSFCTRLKSHNRLGIYGIYAAMHLTLCRCNQAALNTTILFQKWIQRYWQDTVELSWLPNCEKNQIGTLTIIPCSKSKTYNFMYSFAYLMQQVHPQIRPTNSEDFNRWHHWKYIISIIMICKICKYLICYKSTLAWFFSTISQSKRLLKKISAFDND